MPDNRCVPFEQPRTNGRPPNRLLALLPDADFQYLRPYLRTVPLAAKQILHEQGERLRHVYFPNGGVVSMATVLPDGAMVETGTIGDEGIVGIEAVFSDDAVSSCETIVQVPVPANSAERLSVEQFRRALVARPVLQHIVARDVQVLYAVMARLAACNALHQVPERCARWLLLTHDRIHRQDFQLSHEFLGMMLGVRRPTITVVAGTLQAAGLIRYSQGKIRVLDRRGLEAASCECYPVIRELFDSLNTPDGAELSPTVRLWSPGR
jgi:CRP-like cAMP-binding protein